MSYYVEEKQFTQKIQIQQTRTFRIPLWTPGTTKIQYFAICLYIDTRSVYLTKNVQLNGYDYNSNACMEIIIYLHIAYKTITEIIIFQRVRSTAKQYKQYLPMKKQKKNVNIILCNGLLYNYYTLDSLLA